MILEDSQELRDFLTLVLPGLTIEDVLARTGQRVVYFCHFNSGAGAETERSAWGPVVLKVSDGISPQAIAYIQREIRILSQLKSKDYPRLLFDDVFTYHPDTEQPLRYRRFITIEERIDALPLSAVSDNFRTPEAVVNLLRSLLEALRPIWEGKPPLVHRDLKPANILVKRNNDVVVIDFGIVREQGAAGVTITSSPYGPCTPRYASPEQIVNDKRNITYKSDLFALGIICYELLAGTNPFAPDSSMTVDEIFHLITTYNPPPLYTLDVCSTGFSNIIARMLEKQPYKRYRRIDDLIADLERLNKEG